MGAYPRNRVADGLIFAEDRHLQAAVEHVWAANSGTFAGIS